MLLAGFGIVVFLAARRGAAMTRQIFSNTSAAACIALALSAAAYAIIAVRLDVLTYIAAAMLVVAVFLEAISTA
jgi:hypothetical protein